MKNPWLALLLAFAQDAVWTPMKVASREAEINGRVMGMFEAGVKPITNEPATLTVTH